MSAHTDRTAEHPFLAAMVPEHRCVITRSAEAHEFGAGEILFREGQPANRMFLIHEGQVALETHVPARGDILVAERGANQVIGWSWLVPPYVWHFQGRALARTKATILDGGHLLVASEQNHYLGYELMKSIARVILEVLLAAHERWLLTGARPSAVPVEKPGPGPESIAESIEQRLTAHPFFHALASPHIKALAELAKPVEFEAGQKLFETGEIATGFYVVERGQLVLEAPRPEGAVPVQIIRGGDAMGWSAFCEPYRWHFDGRAVGPATALFFPAADVRERCARDYHLGYEVTKRTTRIMLQRLQGTRNRMWEACRS
jgi:CRP-like cAMP-binding protein